MAWKQSDNVKNPRRLIHYSLLFLEINTKNKEWLKYSNLLKSVHTGNRETQEWCQQSCHMCKNEVIRSKKALRKNTIDLLLRPTILVLWIVEDKESRNSFKTNRSCTYLTLSPLMIFILNLKIVAIVINIKRMLRKTRNKLN